MAGQSNEWKNKDIPTYRKTSGYMENLFKNLHHGHLNPISSVSLASKILIKSLVCGKDLIMNQKICNRQLE